MDRHAIIDRLRRFEGSTDYMYRRRSGEVAIGVGHVIASLESAQRMPWYGAPTSILIAADYDRVKTAVKGLKPDAYARLSKVRLDSESVESLLENDVKLQVEGLRKIVREVSGYPEPAQQALFDMAFHPGATDFRQNRRLLAACSARDWETAALESRRQGIPEERNAEIAALFVGLSNQTVTASTNP